MTILNGSDSVSPSKMTSILHHMCNPYRSDLTLKDMVMPMMLGSMGIGKSALAKQLADRNGARLVALHLPQYDPTDVKGIPVRMEDGTVRWFPSSYLPQQEVITLSKKNYRMEFNKTFKFSQELKVLVFDNDGTLVFSVNDSEVKNFNDIEDQFELKSVSKEGIHFEYSGDSDQYTMYVVDKAVLLLDELTAAPSEVQNAALQLVLDRRVGEYDVPITTPMIGAGNTEDDLAFVHQIPAPLANRMAFFRVEATLGDFLNHATAIGVDPMIISYLEYRGSGQVSDGEKKTGIGRLHGFNPDHYMSGNYAFPTPRSWVRLSEQLKDAPKEIENNIICGMIGKEVGNEFIVFRDQHRGLIDINDILEGNIDQSQDIDIGAQHFIVQSICSKLRDYTTSKEFDETTYHGYIENVFGFVLESINPDICMLMLTIMVHRMKLNISDMGNGDNLMRYCNKFIKSMSKVVR